MGLSNSSRVAIILPANPIRYDKVYGHRYGKHDEVFVVGVSGQNVEDLEEFDQGYTIIGLMITYMYPC